MISLSDTVKRYNALTNIFARSNKTVYLSTKQILRLLSLVVNSNEVIRGLTLSALNLGNISSYQAIHIFSGPLNKKRIATPFKVSTRKPSDEIDISKSSTLSTSSIVPLLYDHSRVDNIFSKEGADEHLSSITNQKNLEYIHRPVQEILQKTIDRAFTLTRTFHNTKLSILSKSLLNKGTKLEFPLNNLTQVSNIENDNFINKTPSVTIPNYDIVSRTLPSIIKSIHTMNKFLNDPGQINKFKIFPAALNNYHHLLGKTNENIASNVLPNITRSISDSVANSVDGHIPSDSLGPLKINKAPVTEHQEHLFDSLFPQYPNVNVHTIDHIHKMLTLGATPNSIINSTLSSLLSNSIELSNVVNNNQLTHLGAGIPKLLQDSNSLDFPILNNSGIKRFVLPLTKTNSYQPIRPFESILGRQQYLNSILPRGVLNTVFQPGDLTKSYETGLNIPNIPAHIYQDNISTLARAHSTIRNMLNMPTQYESVLSNQYAEALVESPREYLPIKTNQAKEIANEFQGTDDLQKTEPLETQTIDYQIPRLEQVVAANPVSKMILNIPHELLSLSTQMASSSLPFLSTFNLPSLFSSIHGSAFADIAQHGLSPIFESPFASSLIDFQNKLVLPSMKGNKTSGYYPTTIQVRSDISEDKSDSISNIIMNDVSNNLYASHLPRKISPNTFGTFGHMLKEHLSNKNIDWRALINTAYYGTTILGGGTSQYILPVLSRQSAMAKNLEAINRSQNVLERKASATVDGAFGSMQLNKDILTNSNFQTDDFPIKRATADFGSVHPYPFSSVLENEEGITSEESEELELRSLGTKLEQIFNDELRKYGIYHDQLSSPYHDDLFDYPNHVEQNEEGITSEESEELELRSLGTKLEQIFNDELRKYGYQ
jgi:hypothetical protein